MSIERERHDAVEVVRINRPEVRNALDRAAQQQLGRILRAAEGDDDVRVIVLTGTGDLAFCAGMDLREFAAGEPTTRDPDGMADFIAFSRHGLRKPVIGAANGVAVAAGFELLLACDLIVAADHARFGLPEVKRGLLAAGGGLRIGRRIPSAIAAELVLTGELIDADRALAIGLVNRVVPAESLLDEALALASLIAGNGPLAVQASKRLLSDAMDLSPADYFVHQDGLSWTVMQSEDAKEGAAAFVEKRAPVWRGR